MIPDARHLQVELSSLGLSLPSLISGAAVGVDEPSVTEAALRGLTPDGFPDRAVLKRRAEFLAGRYAAALALSTLGTEGTVGRLTNGAPDWPEGVVGSITHGAGVALAVVSRRSDYAGLGIDVEKVLADDHAAGLIDLVTTKDELNVAGRGLQTDGLGLQFSAVFSAKESLYKCVHPQTGRFMEFSDATVVDAQPLSPARCTLVLRIQTDLDQAFVAGTQMRVEVTIHEQRAMTLCVWPNT